LACESYEETDDKTRRKEGAAGSYKKCRDAQKQAAVARNLMIVGPKDGKERADG
jgi:hypothetical protein